MTKRKSLTSCRGPVVSRPLLMTKEQGVPSGIVDLEEFVFVSVLIEDGHSNLLPLFVTRDIGAPRRRDFPTRFRRVIVGGTEQRMKGQNRKGMVDRARLKKDGENHVCSFDENAFVAASERGTRSGLRKKEEYRR